MIMRLPPCSALSAPFASYHRYAGIVDAFDDPEGGLHVHLHIQHGTGPGLYTTIQRHNSYGPITTRSVQLPRPPYYRTYVGVADLVRQAKEELMNGPHTHGKDSYCFEFYMC